MSQYYYAVASLPYLKSGEKSPITWDRFYEIVRSSLSEKDLEIFEKARLGIPTQTDEPFLKNWFDWEKELKKELARLRLQKAGFDNPNPLPETLGVFSVSEVAKSLFLKDNPLEAEYLLDGIRWAFLEDLLLGHYFDLETVLAYSLKLQILQRQELFEKTLGQENYQNTYKTIVQNLEINRESV
ncbi:MAG: hypothetical protein A2Z96_05260 [Spirochaetes bacterium GWB1_48_6]|nr:MAG: hypothetical protein A2Z96_05260 [Spirochaetes bacterium GWB1_48_6]